MVYSDGLNKENLLFSGANIDPSNKDDLKIPEKRNCAETQAVQAASRNGFELQNLQIMFLYRSPEFNRLFTAEKLLPCLVCNKLYINSLIANKGKLVLIIDDHLERKFINADHIDPQENQASKLHFDGHQINYLVLNYDKMLFLNIEKALGSRVCEL